MVVPVTILLVFILSFYAGNALFILASNKYYKLLMKLFFTVNS